MADPRCTLLFVCTGNICRSPIAEALLKAKLPGRDIWSAGTMAMVIRTEAAVAASNGFPKRMVFPLCQSIAPAHGRTRRTRADYPKV